MQAYLLTFLFPFPLPISGNIEKQPNMACYDFSAQNTGELGVFCSIGKGGTEVLVFMGQGIFFSLLSLSQVLLSHPSLSDLRITRNHLLLSGWICLCQIMSWGRDFGETRRHSLFLHTMVRNASQALMYNPGHGLQGASL